MALKNTGRGMAFLDRWYVYPDRDFVRGRDHEDVGSFRRLTRDLYIAASEFGFWQGALRDRDDPQWHDLAEAITEHRAITVDLLYADLEGGQRTITRITMMPRHEADGWITSVSRHWHLDGGDPR